MSLRIAFFGFGKHALRERAEPLAMHPGVHIVGAADPLKSARDAFSLFAPEAQVVEDSQTLFDRSDWSVAVVCASVRRRARLALEAVRHGRHVLLSLPAALNLEELALLEEACALARERQLLIWPVRPLLFDPFFLNLLDHWNRPHPAMGLSRLELSRKFSVSVWAPHQTAQSESVFSTICCDFFDALQGFYPHQQQFRATLSRHNDGFQLAGRFSKGPSFELTTFFELPAPPWPLSNALGRVHSDSGIFPTPRAIALNDSQSPGLSAISTPHSKSAERLADQDVSPRHSGLDSQEHSRALGFPTERVLTAHILGHSALDAPSLPSPSRPEILPVGGQARTQGLLRAPFEQFVVLQGASALWRQSQASSSQGGWSDLNGVCESGPPWNWAQGLQDCLRAFLLAVQTQADRPQRLRLLETLERSAQACVTLRELGAYESSTGDPD